MHDPFIGSSLPSPVIAFLMREPETLSNVRSLLLNRRTAELTRCFLSIEFPSRSPTGSQAPRGHLVWRVALGGSNPPGPTFG